MSASYIYLEIKNVFKNVFYHKYLFYSTFRLSELKKMKQDFIKHKSVTGLRLIPKCAIPHV